MSTKFTLHFYNRIIILKKLFNIKRTVLRCWILAHNHIQRYEDKLSACVYTRYTARTHNINRVTNRFIQETNMHIFSRSSVVRCSLQVCYLQREIWEIKLNFSLSKIIILITVTFIITVYNPVSHFFIPLKNVRIVKIIKKIF